MITLSIVDTLMATLPLWFGVIIYYTYLDRAKDLIIAGARMVLQLVAIGYLLAILFDIDLPLLGIAIMLFMIMVASAIAIRPLTSRGMQAFFLALASLLTASVVNLAWMIFVVLKLEPWYQAHIVIPLAGMVFSTAMNTLSLAAERYEYELEKSTEDALKLAFNAAMIPQINTLLAVGLVALPGMMTGQILSGVSPVVAVRYQIMIMSMMVGASAISLTVYFYLYKKFTVKPI